MEKKSLAMVFLVVLLAAFCVTTQAQGASKPYNVFLHVSYQGSAINPSHPDKFLACKQEESLQILRCAPAALFLSL